MATGRTARSIYLTCRPYNSTSPWNPTTQMNLLYFLTLDQLVYEEDGSAVESLRSFHHPYTTCTHYNYLLLGPWSTAGADLSILRILELQLYCTPTLRHGSHRYNTYSTYYVQWVSINHPCCYHPRKSENIGYRLGRCCGSLVT